MGSTIRRQPITFNIPPAPNYKHLNITNFKGLNITDNPFTAAPETASDCLNVYIDDNNALTTRPRIEKLFDLKNNIPGFKKLLHVYKMDTCGVIQVELQDEVCLYHIENKKLNKIITGTIGIADTEYGVFENLDKVYLCGNDGYYYYNKKDLILHSVIDDENTYVPVTGIGTIGSSDIVESEPANILSNKHRIEYYWDLESDISKVVNGGKLISNGYVQKFSTDYFKDDLFSYFHKFNNGVIRYSNYGGSTRELNVTITDKSISDNTTTLSLSYTHSFDIEPLVVNEQIKYTKASAWITSVDNGTATVITRKDNALSNKNIGDTISVVVPGELCKASIVTFNGDSIQQSKNYSFGGAVCGISNNGKYIMLANEDGFGFVVYNTIENTYNHWFFTSDITNPLRLSTVYSGFNTISDDGVFVFFITSIPDSQSAYDYWTLYRVNTSTEEVSKVYDSISEKNSLSIGRFVLRYNNKSNTIFMNCDRKNLLITNCITTPKTTIIDFGIYATEMDCDSEFTTFCGFQPGSESDDNFYLVDLTDISKPVKRVYAVNGVFNRQVVKLSTDKKWCGVITDNKLIRLDFSNGEYYSLYDIKQIPADSYYKEVQQKAIFIGVNSRYVLNYVEKFKELKPDMSGVDFIELYTVDALVPSSKPLIVMEYGETNHSDEQEIFTDELTTKFISFADKPFVINLKDYDIGRLIEVTVFKDESLTTKGVQTIQFNDIYQWENGFNSLIFKSGVGDENYLGVLDFNYDKVKQTLTITPKPSWHPSLPNILARPIKFTVVYSKYSEPIVKQFEFNSVLRFQNNFWFYGNSNVIMWTSNNDPTYITEYNRTALGVDSEEIVDMCVAAFDTALALKPHGMFVIKPIEIKGKQTYSFIESKSDVGVVHKHISLISPLNEVVVLANNEGVYGIQQLKNVQSTERNATLLTERINSKYIKNTKKVLLSGKYKYWMLFVSPKEKDSEIFVLDERTMQWFYWNIPIKVDSLWTADDVVSMSTEDGKIYKFATTDLINKYNPQTTEYYDDGEKIIPWFWKSQILPMGTINYSKKLVTSTFILADTDTSDEYGINYTFKAFRKLSSETSPTTLSNKLNYVQSVTKRTMIHRFKFLQFELSNIADDLNNNKFRLIGLSLKYVLLEGMN